MTNSHAWTILECVAANPDPMIEGETFTDWVQKVWLNIHVADGTGNETDYPCDFTFPVPDVAPKSYTPASQVTAALLIAWVQQSQSPDGTTMQEVLETAADAFLALKIVPPTKPFVPAS